jgi:hypothetical protein
MSKICPCPNPPGGHIVCEDNQFGMCSYQSGKQIGGCKDIPSAIAKIMNTADRNLALVNWILGEITGQSRAPSTEVSEWELKMLRSGEIRFANGTHTRFTLPNEVDLDQAAGAGGMVAG